jgi:hypothetical protein
MTLIQASIAAKGESIIMIADRLLTMKIAEDIMEYEFESVSPKLVLQDNVGIGFAGNAIYADIAMGRVSEVTGINNIIGAMSNLMTEEKQATIEQIVHQYSGLTAEEFFKNSNINIPQEIINLIYGQVGGLNLQFQGLVAGFNEDKPLLAVIGPSGEKIEVTNFDSFAIGSGQTFSRLFFDMFCYDSNKCDEVNGLFFGYKAKKWSEAPTGVGRRTDILILRRDGGTISIFDDDPLMKELDKVYIKEQKILDRERAKLLKGFKQKVEEGDEHET